MTDPIQEAIYLDAARGGEMERLMAERDDARAELAKTVSNFDEFAETVAERNAETGDALYRVGRKVGRTVYRQVGPEASDADELIGLMDTPDLARVAVAAMSRDAGTRLIELQAERGELALALERALAEVADLRALFDLQWTRMGEATDRWRAEDPEARALVMPDLGALLQWLIAERDAQRERADKLAQTVAAFPDAHHAANLAHARAERDRRGDELRRVQAVVDAAKAWRDAIRDAPDDDELSWADDPYLTIAHALYTAVDALDEQDGKTIQPFVSAAQLAARAFLAGWQPIGPDDEETL